MATNWESLASLKMNESWYFIVFRFVTKWENSVNLCYLIVEPFQNLNNARVDYMSNWLFNQFI